MTASEFAKFLYPTRGQVCLASASVAFVLLLGGCATNTYTPLASFPDPATMPPQGAMPDPLTMFDGSRVASKSHWHRQRRPELKALFAHYMYGAIPPKPADMHVTVLGQYPDFLDGEATLRLVRLEPGPGGPKIDLLLVMPNNRPKPVPVFLAMNFCGNHQLTPDPRVPLPSAWTPDWCPGCTNNSATAAGRGGQALDWPLDDIVRRGYALASFYSGDVDPDRGNVSDGVYRWLAGGDPSRNNPTNRGTIAAWAWGFHRCVDYLVTEPALDSKCIAALGHSRNGKTALLAAAFDERIAMAFPHQAGCGGSAPSRGKVGESVKQINDRFPHWFNGEFKKFNLAPERLPFDQNALVALCAPRPVLFSAAEGDQWANPAGQFEVLKAADSVYRFLGVEGLGSQQRPAFGQLLTSRLGYYIREGKHSMTADDWHVFLDFADAQMKNLK